MNNAAPRIEPHCPACGLVGSPPACPCYRRESGLDRRIHRGDDYAADAWIERLSGKVVHVAVGYHPSGVRVTPMGNGLHTHPWGTM